MVRATDNDNGQGVIRTLDSTQENSFIPQSGFRKLMILSTVWVLIPKRLKKRVGPSISTQREKKKYKKMIHHGSGVKSS